DQDVGRLDVAMDQALSMGILQGVRYLGEQFGGRARVRRTFLQALFQSLSFDKLRDQEADTFVGLTDFVEGHDAGMFQLSDAAGFAQEPAGLFIVRQAADPLDLEGDRALQLRVAGPENVAKGAGPELGLK